MAWKHNRIADEQKRSVVMANKEKRNMKKARYMLAVIITVAVFMLGILTGINIENNRYKRMEKLAKEQETEFNSLQLQYIFLEQLGENESCAVILGILENNLRTLDPILKKIESYETNGNINDEDYINLKRQYTIANLRYWILAKKSQKICKTDLVNILYFYTTDCESCKDQGFILSYLKSNFGDQLLVFPIDANLDEPNVRILKTMYNISSVSSYPILIIEEKKFEKFMSKKEILKQICPLYKKQWELCEGFE